MIAKYVILTALFGLALGNDYECGDDSLIKKEKGENVPSKLPWAVILKAEGFNTEYDICPGILISDTKILTYGCYYKRGGWVQIFTDRKQMVEYAIVDVPGLPTTTIKDSVWEPYGKKFNVLKLKEPLKLSKSVAPICVSETKPDDASDKLFFFWENNVTPGETIYTIIHRLYISDKSTRGVTEFATFKHNGRWYFDEDASGHRKALSNF